MPFEVFSTAIALFPLVVTTPDFCSDGLDPDSFYFKRICFLCLSNSCLESSLIGPAGSTCDGQLVLIVRPQLESPKSQYFGEI